MGVEEAGRLLQRLEHLAAGLVRLARLAQEPRQAVMDLGRVGVVEQGQGAVGGDRLVALAQLLGGAGELAVRGRDQRIDGQEPRAFLARPCQSLAASSSSISRR